MNYYLLGQKIRKLRTLHHMSQANLAEIIDVSTNYIGQIERGDRKPSLETLVALCNVLNTSMDYILSDSIPQNEDQLTLDILNKIQLLNEAEKRFFYSTITDFLYLKEHSKSETDLSSIK